MNSKQEPGDLAVLNARVWTGNPEQPEAEAVAVRRGAIVAVGATDAARTYCGPGTRVIDAAGRRLIPGITDSHTHLLWAGEQLLRLDLRSAASRADFVQRVADAAGSVSPGRWLRGGSYAVEHWARPEQPAKAWIDPVTGATPTYLTRADLHMALANSAALAAAKITRDGPADPPGGTIERDPHTGEPTGIVKDAAMELVEAVIPPATPEENANALTAACRAAGAWGITSVHDMSWPEHVAAYAAFRDAGRLSLRVFCYWTAVDFAAAWDDLARYNTGDPLLRVVGYKAFMDGSLGSRTAWFCDPYADAAPDAPYPWGLRSKWSVDQDAFARSVRWAHDRGVGLAIHAIGDRAVKELLDLYATLPEIRSARHRIEHAQHVRREDVGRFADLGVIASMQPMHKADDGPWAISAIGSERMAGMYAWGSLLRAGATVCFGSDVPVATNNPFAGMRVAETGLLADGAVCLPEQNIAREAALRAYTTAPPAAVGCANALGVIAPGYRADLALLDRDVLTCSADALPDARAELTVVDGRVTWPPESATSGA